MCCVYHILNVNKNYIIFVLKKKKERKKRNKIIAIHKDLISFEMISVSLETSFVKI